MELKELLELAEKTGVTTSDWRWDRGPYPKHQGVSAVCNGRLIDLTDSFHMTTGERHSEMRLGRFIAASNPLVVAALVRVAHRADLFFNLSGRSAKGIALDQLRDDLIALHAALSGTDAPQGAPQ